MGEGAKTPRRSTENRRAVSLRIPRETASIIEDYASENALRKTDAYLHFLEEGIRGAASKDIRGSIDALSDKIDAMARLLKAEGANPDANQTPMLTIDAIRRIVSEVAATHPAIRKAWLFGSYARGTQTEESDIDIRIELDRSKRFNLHDLASAAKRIEQESGRPCDIVSATTIGNEDLARAIERDKVLLYDRQGK